ncbi:universal stress protein [Janthinobacterium sp. RB2P8]|uniref:universal stress protein n=1 Tax=Janthinobacterium sp. RB2P8 TaxID=3424191 RepID=UPI003F256A25
MAYKSILVHADLSRHAPQRIAIAARLAHAHQAHLIGAAMTGVSRFYLENNRGMRGAAVAAQISALHGQAQAALDQFETLARQAGAVSLERRLIEDDEDGGMAVSARYSDLTVLSQHDDSEALPGAMSDLVPYVMLNAARPVLIVPRSGQFAQVGTQADTLADNTVVVAWDGSMEATRAIGHALPLLRAARLVVLALLHPPAGHAQPARHPGADIAAYLSRHGVPVEVRQTITTGDIGAALLGMAAEVHAGLLVMGGYGHARFREILLGGVTETVLRQMTLPVLMAH